jgi:heme-degrading monooxygenase HmoA
MIARRWKARCPKEHEKKILGHLHRTGIQDSAVTEGFLGAQVFRRNLAEVVEITLITYWKNYQAIAAFAGEDIGLARLYPEDKEYAITPDHHVTHYEVLENLWT